MIELPHVKPGESDASYLIRPIQAGDIDQIVAATQRQAEQGHLRGDRISEEDYRELLGEIATHGEAAVAAVTNQGAGVFGIVGKSAFLEGVWVGFFLERTAFGRSPEDDSSVTDFDIEPWYDTADGPGAIELHVLAVAPEVEDEGRGEAVASRLLDEFMTGRPAGMMIVCRCLAPSDGMRRLLGEWGFEQRRRDAEGTTHHHLKVPKGEN